MTDTVTKLRKQFVYKTTLTRTYGFTPKLIAELGAPDLTVTNKHYRHGPPAQLFAIVRVEAFAEKHKEELARLAAGRQKRQAASKKAVDTKRKATVEWARKVIIKVVIPGDVEQRARSHYAAQDWGWSNEGAGGYVNFNGVLAYCRHNCTNYEELLLTLFGKPGSDDGYQILKDRMNSAVDKALREKDSKGAEIVMEAMVERGDAVETSPGTYVVKPGAKTGHSIGTNKEV